MNHDLEAMREETLKIVLQVMLDMMKKDDGTEHNYMQVSLGRHDKEYVFTLQRKDGKSPHDLYQKEQVKTEAVAAILNRLDWKRVDRAAEPIRDALNAIRAVLEGSK